MQASPTRSQSSRAAPAGSDAGSPPSSSPKVHTWSSSMSTRNWARRPPRSLAPPPSRLTSPTAPRSSRWPRASSGISAASTSLPANAGVYPFADLDALDEQVWNSVMDLNVGGAVRCVRACLPTMRARALRRIVLNVVDHRAGHRPARVRALRRVEGGAARLHALGGCRARADRDHDQRGHAGETSARRASPIRATSTSSECSRRSDGPLR